MFQPRKILQRQQIFKLIDQLISNIHLKLKKSPLLISHKKLPVLPQPKSLKGGELKDYQLQALSWMVQLANNNLSGILADDMGLGKTIQTIAYLSYIYETKNVKGKHLIVVPKNVLNNWMRQLQKWNPIFKAVILPGTEQERQQCLKKHIRTSDFDILIATYQSVQTAERALKRFSWETLVVDEAHSIKNDETRIATCLRKFTANFCLLLTGTPLSNQLKQLWSLLNFIVPDIFQDSQLFRCIQDSVNLQCKNEEQKIKYQSELAGKFKAIINPFILRRIKAELSLGLKQKKQFTLFVSLQQTQLKMYRNFLKYHTVYGEGEGYQGGTHIQLRKICGHPYLFPDIQDPNAPPYGDHLIMNCGKMKLLDKLLAKLLKQKHKILIFSQFVIFLKILEDYCNYREYKYSLISGQSSLDQRDEQVNTFSNSEDTNLFLISTRAGGLGLNLVAADVVILYDLDWNPQIDKQATDRAYRIGQKNSVKVFKLITLNTIQQRILQVQKYKLIWDQLVIQKGGLAKVKAAEQKFQKIDYNKLAGLGAEEIFKLQQNFDDKTIDEIIKMGEQKDKQKTEQIRKKLQKQLKAYNNESFNPFQNLFQGKTANMADIDYEAQRIKKSQKNNKQKPSWRDRKQAKHKLFIQPKPHYLFSDLQAAGQLLYRLNQISDQQQKQKQRIKGQLLKLGFYQWKNSQFQLFFQANLMYQSDDYKSIAKYIKTKTAKQVQKYSEQYFEKADGIPRLSKGYKKIKNRQHQIQKDKAIKELYQRIKQTPYQIFNYRPRQRKMPQITRQALTWMHFNGIKQQGICLQEHQDMLRLINGEMLERVKKNFATSVKQKSSYQRALTQKTQQQIRQLMEVRYENLHKKFLESEEYTTDLNAKDKQKLNTKNVIPDPLDQQDSAKTQIKR